MLRLKCMQYTCEANLINSIATIVLHSAIQQNCISKRPHTEYTKTSIHKYTCLLRCPISDGSVCTPRQSILALALSHDIVAIYPPS